MQSVCKMNRWPPNSLLLWKGMLFWTFSFMQVFNVNFSSPNQYTFRLQHWISYFMNLDYYPRRKRLKVNVWPLKNMLLLQVLPGHEPKTLLQRWMEPIPPNLLRHGKTTWTCCKGETRRVLAGHYAAGLGICCQPSWSELHERQCSSMYCGAAWRLIAPA